MAFKRFKRLLRKTDSSPGNNRKKVGIFLFATSIGLFFLFAARFTYLITVGKVAGISLEEKTDALYQGSKTVKARRGTIYDRNGVAIAEDATSYSAYAIISKKYMTGTTKLYAQEKDFAAIAKVLHDHIGLDEKETVKRLTDGAATKDGFQVNFSKNISLQEKEKIEKELEKAKIKGLYFEEHPARIYPNGVFASHLIGYADLQEKNGQESVVGRMGIEAAYDDILKGKDGKIVFQKDNYQNPLPGTVAEKTASVDGQDIYTTIDSRLQVFQESLMDDMVKEYEPKSAFAMLVEAKTGEILTMSQRPTFNPESKTEFGKKGFEWMNLPVQDAFEPGSTMKAMTVAAGIEEGKFNPNETFVSGEMKLIDATIRDHDLGAKGTLTMRQALSWSSNVGMVRLEQKIGGTTWTDYLKRFGFGTSTYSGLPGENAGTLPTNNIVDQAMSAYGQALNVSALQMVRAYTAFANDGKMLQPQYISKIVNNDTNTERVTQPEVVGTPISADTAKQVTNYLRDTVESENYGTAYGVLKVGDYHISAKTGTGQIYDSKNGGYLDGDTNYLYSVMELIPSEDPEYIMYIAIQQPKKWTQKAYGDISNAMLKRAMEFKNETQLSTEASTEKVKVADYRNLASDDAAADATKNGLVPVVIGTGDKIKAQSTVSGTKLMPGERLIMVTTGDKLYMPDVSGWSKADLMKLGKLLDIKVNFTGDGYATKQSIAPYAKIEGDSIDFTLE